MMKTVSIFYLATLLGLFFAFSQSAKARPDGDEKENTSGGLAAKQSVSSKVPADPKAWPGRVTRGFRPPVRRHVQESTPGLVEIFPKEKAV